MHHRKLVLVQGTKYWRVEDLVRQSKLDMVRSARDRAALSAPIYDHDEIDGKIVILKGDDVVFVEAGSDIKTV